MARIERVEAGYYRIPLPEALSDSTHGTIAAFELVTLRVRDADGAEGLGYTYTTGRNGAAIHAVAAREIAELATGAEAERIEALWQRLWWALHYGGRGGPSVLALSAFDIALWDLKAKRAGLPLWLLLGGHEPRVACYAGGIDLHLSAAELVAQAGRTLARGFRAIKMKVGRARLGEDVERLAAMRAHLGADFPLMVDANMAWTADVAIRAARAFAPYAPLWLEEPVAPEDVAGHARVVREGGLPVAAGENLRSLWEFQALIAAGGVSYPEPDATNCGGVTAFMKIARLAEAHHLPVTSHGAHDVTVHLLAACPNASYLEVHGFGLDRFLEHPLRLEEGRAVAPERPGHGVALDWAGLAPLAAA
ncbi:racemase [Caldovatus sediminis]|uniref:Racemase n=1 Tax=Caldovatus sediminis TaxID=2041189 RepID=A0A8J3EAQ3_9PROT|nr:mandelate racemase/muconate lactonizing enzyme family protein [Caldovatus sediminis]GGG29706.1 racemase [Caldovatus sediminis]